MNTIIKHQDAEIHICEVGSGRRRLTINKINHNLFVPFDTCVTCYPIDLIKEIVEQKGPAYVCDEILREESPEYIQKSLYFNLLSYVSVETFRDKRLLDFGCGSGASTLVLTRMLPCSEIVGIELEPNLLAIAYSRAEYYGYGNIKFLQSPQNDQLPEGIGSFDFIVLSAVYEHFLPEERALLMPKLWNLLNPGGILFLNQTPYRYFPIETHTTSGLPLINYLSDRWTLFLARHWSRRNLKNDSWQELLRKGIRGGSVKEISGILSCCRGEPVMLQPSRLGIHDRVDLWYAQARHEKFRVVRSLFYRAAKGFNKATGVMMLPYLSLAFRKG